MLKNSPQYRQRSKLGILGEKFAASYLLKHGFRILERNFKARYGEIDIVAKDHDTVVFVEVKTRSGNVYGSPEDAVTPRKLREVIQTAQYYQLTRNLQSVSMRIDVVAIVLDPFTFDVRYFKHIPNVTL